MTPKERDEAFALLDAACKKLHENKGVEYAGTVDVLANFKRNAERLGMSPFQIWAVYFNKHIDAINSSIARNASMPIGITEPIEGRVADAINYLKLFFCLCEEVQKEHRDAYGKKPV